jgi:metallophosphoesterase superfamily enzyme
VVAVKNRHASGRCFAHTDEVLLMPAFGSFTGGLNLAHAAFKSLLKGEIPYCYLLHRNSIFKIPLS